MSEIDVAVVKLGLDAAVRAEVQRTMSEIASSGDTTTPAGLVQMLREAIVVLRGVEERWTHGAVQNASPMPPAEAERRFAEVATDARTRFDTEVIRSTGGEVRTADADLPRSDAPSMVVVTIVVAAKRALRDVGDVDRAAFKLALDDLAAVHPSEFVAMEVVWSPADENDRPPVAEVEANYPELVRFAPAVS